MTVDRRTAMGLGAAGLASFALPAFAAPAGSRFQVKGNDFLLDGKPLQILAGEMHYPRIPRALWRDRLRKMRALGLNTLSAYMFWNIHEQTPGVFDFSDNLDVAAWVRMAQEEGLQVLLRPGPYVCAEWDGGGLPAWLLPDAAAPVRSADPRFMKPTARWLKRLGEELAPLQIDRGGPIIMTQIENEYGAFGSDQRYLGALVDATRAAGFTGQLYTVDGASVMEKGSIPGIPSGINFGTFTPGEAEKAFKERAEKGFGGPAFCSEFWSGWFNHWHETQATTTTENVVANLKWMLDRKMSVSFYMFHGGTSFGTWAGANLDVEKNVYEPDISSYDYDALLDEAGRPTAKYAAVRKLLADYLPADSFHDLPAPEKALTVAPFALGEVAPLAQLLGAAQVAHDPQTLEGCGRAAGMLLYRHRLAQAVKGQLSLTEVRDLALVTVDGKPVATLDRRRGDKGFAIDAPAGAVIEVLVDAMGHANYGLGVGRDQKGLIGPVSVDGTPLKGWDHRPVLLEDVAKLTFTARRGGETGPAFYRGSFTANEAGFTFLDLRGWGKGYVWVNGRNLGRYWSAGPQRGVFVPAPWLKVGANEVVVLDLFGPTETVLSGRGEMIWDRAAGVTTG
ncbi:beta-galactosidase family protein [Novosphingobium sp.]|uniref:glycoside hydrolase family 35 protein n=1 Tax=Novosphingobium sp. TaxID=1874826 RepID=UPI0026094E73|nr:beta-galactosidase family protein [Novosphingobium sp.]